MLTTAVLLSFLASAPADVRDLSWMSGCWAFEKNGRSIREVWLAPSSNMMFGVGRTERDGRVVEFESMRIEQKDDGAITFVASPSGQSTAEFRLIETGERSVAFENKEHDFPQRISYQRSGDGLLAIVSGPSKSGTKEIRFAFTRTKCE